MIDELSTKVTDFFYDYDPYEFKDNYEDYNEGLEETKKVLTKLKKLLTTTFLFAIICLLN